MSSPDDSTNGDSQPAIEQVTFRFCRNCSNLLYPKEDRESRKLIYKCQTCIYHEDATSMCVHRRHLEQTVSETAGITHEFTTDPTLPRSDRVCPSCGEAENVNFQPMQRSEDTGMKSIYVCCNCGKIFDQKSSKASK